MTWVFLTLNTWVNSTCNKTVTDPLEKTNCPSICQGSLNHVPVSRADKCPIYVSLHVRENVRICGRLKVKTHVRMCVYFSYTHTHTRSHAPALTSDPYQSRCQTISQNICHILPLHPMGQNKCHFTYQRLCHRRVGTYVSPYAQTHVSTYFDIQLLQPFMSEFNSGRG